MKRVVVFGTFDSLHEGHRSFLRQARELGDELMVVAAHDSYIRVVKQREPRVPAPQRQEDLLNEPVVSEVRWGDEWPTGRPYRLLAELDFDVLALGYDQEPSDEVVREELCKLGKDHVTFIRLPQYAAGH